MLTHFNGSIRNPLNSSDLFSLSYHLGTSQAWIGPITGRVEIRAYRKRPVFGLIGFGSAPCQVVDIDGARSYIYQWNNTRIPRMDMTVEYYRETSASDGL